ncbi:MAG: hypothetical protein H7281_00540 [Bacteriovorax sp.]|nr:hypothetical protein [Bacteriovorax sp.]
MQNKTINDLGTNPALFQNDEKILYLEARILKLGEICNDLNPYTPIPEDFKFRLREFNIMEFSDPFKITNALLMLLEDTIDELHILKPFNDN